MLGKGEGKIEKGKNETLNSEQKLGNEETSLQVNKKNKYGNTANSRVDKFSNSKSQIFKFSNIFNPILRFFK